MKTQKFKIGDLVSYKTGYNTTIVGKITRIIIPDKGITEYSIDGYNAEEDKIELIESANNEPQKQEQNQKLPKTYKEALQLFNDTIYYIERGTIFTASSYNIIDPAEFNHPFSATRVMASMHSAFEKLIFLRDIYRQGWKPDYYNYKQDKYVIISLDNELHTGIYYRENRPLSFQSKEIRDLFLENFKDLIEECKEFI